MDPIRHRSLLETIHNLERNAEAADAIAIRIAATRALQDPGRIYEEFAQLNARVRACAIYARQIATQYPQIAEVAYD